MLICEDCLKQSEKKLNKSLSDKFEKNLVKGKCSQCCKIDDCFEIKEIEE